MRNTLWDEMRRMQEQMDSLFNTFFDRGSDQSLIEGPGTRELSAGFKTPNSDVYETEDSVIAEIEMPGVNKDDISVNITEEGFEASAKTQTQEKNKLSRNYSRIYRSFPMKVDANSAEAEYTNGVLRVIVPKLEENKKQLEIK